MDNSRTQTDREIRRLHQQADDLEFAGDPHLAGELRQSALMLANAEAQRTNAIAETHREINLLHERLRTMWQLIGVDDPYWMFARRSEHPDVAEVREHLRRQETRLALLEAAKA